VVPEVGAREKDGFFCFLALSPPMLSVRGEAKYVIFFISFFSIQPVVRGFVVGKKGLLVGLVWWWYSWSGKGASFD